MKIETETPSTIAELRAALNTGPTPPGFDDSLPKFWLYRGCANVNWGLETSLIRLSGDTEANEERILADFKTYAADGLAGLSIDLSSDLQVLTVAQHFGAPTRLLDWSKDPEVALHFATSEVGHYDVDGAIWIANLYALHSTAIAPKVSSALWDSPRGMCSPARQSRFLETYPDRATFDLNFMAGANMPALFFEPNWSIPRIGAQASVFSIVADAATGLDSILDEIVGSCRKVVVSSALKAEIRRDLDGRNNDERRYFSGLEGVGRFLTRSNHPRVRHP